MEPAQSPDRRHIAEATTIDCYGSAPLAAKKSAKWSGSGVLSSGDFVDCDGEVNLLERKPPIREEIVRRPSGDWFARRVDGALSIANMPAHSW